MHWNEFLQKRGKFPLLIALLLAPSGCGVNTAWLQRDVRKGMHVHCKASRRQRNGEQVRGVAVGCSNTPSNRKSLLKLTSDGVLRRIWEKQVQRTQAHWKATKHLFLCSDHFTESLFQGGVGCHGGLRWREGRLYS